MLDRRSLLVALSLAAALGARQTSADEFDWLSVTPSAQLEYHECHDGFKCARLALPLDWQDPENNATVAVAITVLPAVVPESDPSFGGTIFLNPGGPGGSGTGFVRLYGSRLQKVADGNKHYEILGFDPRGVARSTPYGDCYQDEYARSAINWQLRGLPALTNDSARVSEYLPYADAQGALCGRTGDEFRKYYSTPAVAHDMVGIVDAIDALRKKTLRARGVAPETSQKVLHDDTSYAQSQDDLPRLQYAGFSYGTMLGNTFASLFPGRVGRLLIDGVVDPYDYSGGLWGRNLLDAEAIIDYFFSSCFESDACSLRQPGDKDGQSIRARVETLIQDLDQSPAVVIKDDSMPVLLRGIDVRQLLLQMLYAPLTKFPLVDSILAPVLARGNYSALLPALDLPTASGSCSRSGAPPPPDVTDYAWNRETQLTYICGDAEDVTNTTADQYAAHVAMLQQQAPAVAAPWAALFVACTAWKTRPKWRFTGPFASPEADPSGAAPGRPAAPLLILSTRYDPVTPLENAYKVAKGHPGSAVVVQESHGHCALFSAPSRCTKKIVEHFFEFGEVPEGGAVCDVDCKPWEACDMSLGDGGFLAAEGFPSFQLGV